MNEFQMPGQLSLDDLHARALALLNLGDRHTSKILMRAHDELAQLRIIAGALLEDQGAKYKAARAITPGHAWKMRGGDVVEVLRIEVLQGTLTVTLKYPQRGEEVDVSAKYLLTWCKPLD